MAAFNLVLQMIFGWMPPILSAITIGLLSLFVVLAVFALISAVLKALPFV